MQRVEGSDDKIKAKGQFYWRVDKEGKRVLVLAIPYGTGRYVHSEWTIDHKNGSDAQWGWDGNEDQPTLKPSLHAVGIWHGYVRKGMMVEA